MDEERRQWLGTLIDACERVIANHRADPADALDAAIREEVIALLSRLRRELDADG